jgi:hypothetical protein
MIMLSNQIRMKDVKDLSSNPVVQNVGYNSHCSTRQLDISVGSGGLCQPSNGVFGLPDGSSSAVSVLLGSSPPQVKPQRPNRHEASMSGSSCDPSGRVSRAFAFSNAPSVYQVVPPGVMAQAPQVGADIFESSQSGHRLVKRRAWERYPTVGSLPSEPRNIFANEPPVDPRKLRRYHETMRISTLEGRFNDFLSGAVIGANTQVFCGPGGRVISGMGVPMYTPPAHEFAMPWPLPAPNQVMYTAGVGLGTTQVFSVRPPLLAPQRRGSHGPVSSYRPCDSGVSVQASLPLSESISVPECDWNVAYSPSLTPVQYATPSQAEDCEPGYVSSAAGSVGSVQMARCKGANASVESDDWDTSSFFSSSQ